MNPEHLNILGVNVSAINMDLACRTIDNWIKELRKNYVCVVPVSTVMSCQEDEKYREIVNRAGMATPDGVPLVWIGKLRKNRAIERTYGPDLMLALCERGQNLGYKHYFYGGTGDSLQELISTLKERFPKINIAGAYSPPFRDNFAWESEEVLQDINNAAPDLLWVGLGSPKQDYWMSQYQEKLNVPVMLGVGAAFDFISGAKRQAPKWMQKSGLEWFFRLCSEPRRLWRRYLIGNTKFIWLLLKDSLKKSHQT